MLRFAFGFASGALNGILDISVLGYLRAYRTVFLYYPFIFRNGLLGIYYGFTRAPYTLFGAYYNFIRAPYSLFGVNYNLFGAYYKLFCFYFDCKKVVSIKKVYEYSFLAVVYKF